MTWTPAQVLAWLDEVEPRADARSHFEWLELAPTTAVPAIQAAYHQIARSRHPDLFRQSLAAADFDRLTRMYARVSGAYADLRTTDGAVGYLRRTTRAPPVTTRPTAAPARPAAPTPSPARAAAPPAPGPAIDPTRAMNARALVLYRRAEGALRTGDRATALLNIKMAIAADPSSPLLRGALAELEQA
jgi:hypothetical protein